VSDLKRQALHHRGRDLGTGPAIGPGVQVLGLARQGQRHHDLGHGLPAGQVGAEHLGQDGPQRQRRRPERPAGLSEGHLLVGEGLFDLGGGQHLRQREAVALQEGRQGVAERERLRVELIRWHGSRPCSGKASAPGKDGSVQR
jgi:hypothetical protein